MMRRRTMTIDDTIITKSIDPEIKESMIILRTHILDRVKEYQASFNTDIIDEVVEDVKTLFNAYINNRLIFRRDLNNRAVKQITKDNVTHLIEFLKTGDKKYLGDYKSSLHSN